MPGSFFCNYKALPFHKTPGQTQPSTSNCESYSTELHNTIGKCSQISAKTHKNTSPEHVALSGYLQKNIECLAKLKELQEQAAECLAVKGKAR